MFEDPAAAVASTPAPGQKRARGRPSLVGADTIYAAAVAQDAADFPMPTVTVAEQRHDRSSGPPKGVDEGGNRSRGRREDKRAAAARREECVRRLSQVSAALMQCAGCGAEARLTDADARAVTVLQRGFVRGDPAAKAPTLWCACCTAIAAPVQCPYCSVGRPTIDARPMLRCHRCAVSVHGACLQMPAPMAAALAAPTARYTCPACTMAIKKATVQAFPSRR